MISTASMRDYIELCKPKVVALMLVTAVVGMHLATPNFVPFSLLFFATVGIALTASAAAVINHLWDRHIDILMARTQNRPIAQGKVSITKAIIFAVVLTTIGMLILVSFVNTLTAILTFLTLVGYAGIYTIFLKRATPQNIVIGGLAGATPPLLGWTAVTGSLAPEALLLVLIIFTWTPPHFWALAIYRYDDYAKAKIPMLPVTHGIRFTKLSILMYTILLVIVTLLPYLIGMSQWFYLVFAVLLGIGFLYWSVKLLLNNDVLIARKTFQYSINYLLVLFLVLLLDHYLIT